jgi:hypothetical protein
VLRAGDLADAADEPEAPAVRPMLQLAERRHEPARAGAGAAAGDRERFVVDDPGVDRRVLLLTVGLEGAAEQLATLQPADRVIDLARVGRLRDRAAERLRVLLHQVEDLLVGEVLGRNAAVGGHHLPHHPGEHPLRLLLLLLQVEAQDLGVVHAVARRAELDPRALDPGLGRRGQPLLARPLQHFRRHLARRQLRARLLLHRRVVQQLAIRVVKRVLLELADRDRVAVGVDVRLGEVEHLQLRGERLRRVGDLVVVTELEPARVVDALRDRAGSEQPADRRRARRAGRLHVTVERGLLAGVVERADRARPPAAFDQREKVGARRVQRVVELDVLGFLLPRVGAALRGDAAGVAGDVRRARVLWRRRFGVGELGDDRRALVDRRRRARRGELLRFLIPCVGHVGPPWRRGARVSR